MLPLNLGCPYRVPILSFSFLVKEREIIHYN
ncbi:hypothetical protein KEN51_CDS0384 [Pseudomonas phage vB_Pae10145-KEN51]|nr:hypothetical protein [Pseudomonas phage ANB1]WNV50451.1 hypothetical protein [Pseudomonas phage PhiPizzaParty]WRQ05823.1 hypothetical protein IPCDMZAV_CDS0300 [Pseudomonas phage 6B]WRQ06320.1 hypothetical protein QAMIJHJT_CDS0389 [Pseudomonas phage 9-Ps-8B]WRQ06728.1 hypothetical protein FOPPYZMZ_CDS0388 [Pseudomonas phage 9Ps-7B]WRQ07079.1 hypothetical protein ZBUARNPM_CDS0330 [Pseudomonas phage 14Ps5-6]